MGYLSRIAYPTALVVAIVHVANRVLGILAILIVAEREARLEIEARQATVLLEVVLEILPSTIERMPNALIHEAITHPIPYRVIGWQRLK